MLSNQKVRELVCELQAHPVEIDKIIRWSGGRVLCELIMIEGRALQYSAALKGVFPAEVDRRMWGRLVACADLRKRRPHNAQFLAKREQERRDRKGRSPFAGWSTRKRLESDYETLAGLLDDGRTYKQAAAEIAHRNPKKYFRHKPRADNLRKVMQKLGYQRKTVSI